MTHISRPWNTMDSPWKQNGFSAILYKISNSDLQMKKSRPKNCYGKQGKAKKLSHVLFGLILDSNKIDKYHTGDLVQTLIAAKSLLPKCPNIYGYVR